MIINLDSIFSFHQLGERDNQEDSRFPDADAPETDAAVFVVCDGVGGREKGEVASAAVCNQVGRLLASHKNIDAFSTEDFKIILDQAYKALDNAAGRANKEMGTTLTFVAFHSEGVFAGHIGDSRIYQIRPGEGIIYRSEDHSLVNALLRSGNLSPDEMRNHPKSNVITRCMGVKDGSREKDDATVINLQDIAPGDYFLLCTDGVTGKVEEEDLLALYSSDRTDEEKYKYLAEKCRDSLDNNTAIQIHVGQVYDSCETDAESEETMENQDGRVQTRVLMKKENTVHDLSVSSPRTQSKIKAIFNLLLK